MLARFRRVTALVLATSLITMSMPMSALADIYIMNDPPWATSETNPGAIGEYDSVWREGWGNDPLAKFNISIPQPDPGQPAITGAVYASVRICYRAVRRPA